MNKVLLVRGTLCRNPGDMINNLHNVRTDISERLADAASNRRSPMHTPVVTTADADARVMVLREYDASRRRLRFHTDARSPKCAVIADNPQMGVLFYDREAKVQMRCRGTGRVETSGPDADAAWEASTNFARRCYLAENAPGATSAEQTSGLPEWAEGIQPEDEQVIPARVNFAVLLVEVTRIDWLYLSNDGHRRAVFEGDKGRWVVP